MRELRLFYFLPISGFFSVIIISFSVMLGGILMKLLEVRVVKF